MSFKQKVWNNNSNLTYQDLNRIENGIKDIYKELEQSYSKHKKDLLQIIDSKINDQVFYYNIMNNKQDTYNLLMDYIQKQNDKIDDLKDQIINLNKIVEEIQKNE